MTPALNTAAIEAREAASEAWVRANDEACLAYISYVRFNAETDGGFDEAMNRRNRLKAANLAFKKTAAAWRKARKVCEKLGISDE
jgi:hypothetical protein